MAASGALLRNKSGDLKGQDSVCFQNLLAQPFLHLFPDLPKILARRFDVLLEEVVAFDKHESLAVLVRE
jgi:hypothetical protein